MNSKLNAYVVENHDEALPVLYRAIGSKLLPMEASVMVHFDSHPDLLIPRDLQASDVYDKHRLFELVSIENWILPAVFAGHFSTLVWVKPPWSEQIPEGYYQFYIGRHKETSKIRVTSKLPYFVGETLYTAESNLVDKRLVSLYVIDINSWRKLLKVPAEKQVPFIVRQNSQTQTVCYTQPSLVKRGCSETSKSGEHESEKVSEPPDKRLKFDSNQFQKEIPRKLSSSCEGEESIISLCDIETESSGKSTGVFSSQSKTESSQSQCDIETESSEKSTGVFNNQNKSETTSQPQYSLASSEEQFTDSFYESCSSEDISEDEDILAMQSHDDSIVVDESNTSSSYCHFLHSPEWLTLLSLLTKKPYVLDIDLDFFSTRDPFRTQFTTHQYSLIKSIYAFEKPLDESDQSTIASVELRERQLRMLKECFIAVNSGQNVQFEDEDREVMIKDLIRALHRDPPYGITTVTDKHAASTSQVQQQSNEAISSEDHSTPNSEETSGQALHAKSNENNPSEKNMTSSKDESDEMVNNDKVVEIDFDWLHEIGSGCDDTELPHHVSSEREIEELVCSVEDVVGTLPEPKIITVARSSDDDYCPKFQVEGIQRLTLDMIKRLYQHSRITLEYMIDTSP